MAISETFAEPETGLKPFHPIVTEYPYVLEGLIDAFEIVLLGLFCFENSIGNDESCGKITKMDLLDKEEKKKKLLEAFLDLNFQAEIKKEQNAIEKVLLQTLQDVCKNLNSNQLVFRNLESRIKTEHSFSEKLERRDYLTKWRVTDDLNQNIKTIKENLDDLIGFRATCYFLEDEKPLFEAFKKQLESNRILYPFINFDFDVSHKQNNGKDLWKFVGHSNGIPFEVQIKSIINTIWGEVEHEEVYKNKKYNIYDDAKEKMALSIFDILKGSNDQLSQLFSLSYDGTRLLEGLFFLAAIPELAKNGYCDVQSVHFEHFFAVMRDTQTKEKFDKDLRIYISDYLRGSKTSLSIKTKKAKPTQTMVTLVGKYDSYSMRVMCLLYKLMYSEASSPFPTEVSLFLDRNHRLNKANSDEFVSEDQNNTISSYNDQEIYLKQYFGEEIK